MTAKLGAPRSVITDLFGTWFKNGATPEQLIARCTEQIANCEKWLVNLEKLRKEQLKYRALAKKAEIKSYLLGLTPEEVQDILAEVDDSIEDAVILDD